MSGISAYAVAASAVTAAKIELDRSLRDLRIAAIGSSPECPTAEETAHRRHVEACMESFGNAIDTLCYLALVHTVIPPKNFRSQWERFIGMLQVSMPAIAAKEYVAAAIETWAAMDGLCQQPSVPLN